MKENVSGCFFLNTVYSVSRVNTKHYLLHWYDVGACRNLWPNLCRQIDAESVDHGETTILISYRVCCSYCVYIVRARLVGDNRPHNAGRLEVRYNGVWGTVCSNFFGHKDARVACYMLGFG